MQTPKIPFRDRRRVLALAAALVATRLADLATTWLRTPDLAREQNVLRAYFHADWTVLLVGNVVLVLALLGLLAYTERRYDRLVPHGGGLSWRAFWTAWLEDDDGPRYGMRAARVAGLGGAVVFTVVGLVASLHNAAVLLSESYLQFVGPVTPYYWAATIPLGIVALALYARFEYGLYRRRRQPGGDGHAPTDRSVG